MRSPTKVVVVGALVGALIAPAASPAGAVTLSRRAAYATRYLATQQADNGSYAGFSELGTTADAVLAFVAARRGEKQIERAIVYLRRNDESASYGQTAKIVMAVVAAGRNPRNFGGRNLVAVLQRGIQPDGQYGDPEGFAEVTDHTLAMLALKAARARMPRSSVRWLAAAQCPDGGWQFDEPFAPAVDDEHCFNPAATDPADFDRSNSDTTAYAVMALVARPSTVPLDADPFAFFRTLRDREYGGWVYDPSFPSVTNANSTALVIQAYVAEGLRLPKRAMSSLTGLQYPLCGRTGGAFALTYNADGTKSGKDLGATVGAVPALKRKAFPLTPYDVTQPVPRKVPC